MKVKSGRGVVFVSRDSSGAYVELQTSGAGVMDQPGGVLLTRDEARRLAASILFEAGKVRRRRAEAQPDQPAPSAERARPDQPAHPLRRTA